MVSKFDAGKIIFQMYKPLEIAIGLRYTRAKRRNHFISFISFASMLGVMLGVAALIIVISVMNGFHKEIHERILGMASHATISGVDGELHDWRNVADAVNKHPRVIGEAPFVEIQGMLTSRGAVRGALVRGIDPEQETNVSEIHQHMKAGDIKQLVSRGYNIILGKELAAILGVYVGDKVTLVVPKTTVTPAGTIPRLKRFTVSGIFEVGMGKIDSGVAVINISDASRLMRLGKNVTGVRLKLDDMELAPQVTREIAKDLPGIYRVHDWTWENRNFFSALAIEKRMMAIILSLIVVVAAFNIISALVMLVTDKQSDIAIMRTLGMQRGAVMRIFMVQGMVIGFAGMLLGLLLGVIVAINVEAIVLAIEGFFGVHFLDPNIYYISRMPSDVHWDDVAWITGGAFVLTLLATIYPALKAAHTLPAEALRYE